MIWSRHLYKEMLKLFFLAFLSFFLLASLIDFSAHMKSFWQEGVALSTIFTYYLAQLSDQGELLVGISLLLATIKVLTTANVRGEITALLTSGVARRKIAYPLLTLALFFSALLFLNNQAFRPHALAHLTRFEESFFKSKGESALGALILRDQSRLLYRKFDNTNGTFRDLFWIQSFDRILRIDTLLPEEKRAYGVDVIERVDGELVWMTKHAFLDFPEMEFEKKALFEATLPAERQSISQLFANLPAHPLFPHDLRDYEAKVITAFFHKLTSPLLPLLAVIAPIPFCLRFGRRHPLFLLYAAAIAALLTYFVLTESAVILAQSHLFSPFLIVTALPLGAALFFGGRYAQL